MFSRCTSLTTAPKLPATTLARGCYQYMFENCTSLTKAPELPATTLASSCYSYMFNDCSNLNYIKAMFITTDIYSRLFKAIPIISNYRLSCNSNTINLQEMHSTI